MLETIDLHQKPTLRGVEVRTVCLPGEAHDIIPYSNWQKVWDESRRFSQESWASRSGASSPSDQAVSARSPAMRMTAASSSTSIRRGGVWRPSLRAISSSDRARSTHAGPRR